jgi:hypothetical protein
MSVQRLGWCPGVSAKDRGHFSFGTVSNTTARDLILDCTEVDVTSIQVTSTGTLTATITVLASNSFIPGPGDATFGLTSVAGAAPIRAGTFVNITTRVTGIVNPAGAGGDCMINVAVAGEPQVSENFILVRFTPASGSGNLDMYVSGKSFTR